MIQHVLDAVFNLRLLLDRRQSFYSSERRTQMHSLVTTICWFMLSLGELVYAFDALSPAFAFVYSRFALCSLSFYDAVYNPIIEKYKNYTNLLSTRNVSSL